MHPYASIVQAEQHRKDLLAAARNYALASATRGPRRGPTRRLQRLRTQLHRREQSTVTQTP